MAGVSDRIMPGIDWLAVAAGAGVVFSPARTARQVIVQTAGNVYLMKPGASAETLLFTAAVAGQTFNVQFDGVGPSCTAVIAVF